MARAFGQKPARQPAGAGADFEDVVIVQAAGRAGDARGQVEVEQEVLTQRLARRQAVRGDDLAQRGQGVDHAAARLRARRAASRSAAIIESGLACPVPAMSKAVP